MLPELRCLLIPTGVLAALSVPTCSVAQTDTTAAETPSAAAPLYGNLGPHTRRITTASETAQAYFNEGMQFMYGFGPSSALESFRTARLHDPECAMCYWGEAWALSPYLNGSMDLDEERKAYAAITKAKDALHANEVERALIEAMAVRFAEKPSGDMRKSLDTLYAHAMRAVVTNHPDDLDALTLYAESLMLLRPRRGSVDLGDPSVREILPIFETILALNIEHPGACHLYIHLVEASQEPERAEECADRLGNAIPGASHVHHMPSHIYMNVGRYGDAVRSNLDAWHTDQRASHGGPPGIYPSHNLHMLMFAATLDGQSAIAIQAAKDLAKIATNSAFYYPVTLAFFGRWDDVLELTDTPSDDFQAAMWRFARGMAYLRGGEDRDAALTELDQLQSLRDRIPDDRNFRFHSQHVLLGIPLQILRGELAAAGGQTDDAIEILREAVQIEDSLVYDEPEPWHQSARHYLGAVLLESARAVEAESVYRKALEDHPNTGWALFGLAQALEAQGRDDEAHQVRAEFALHWSRSDVWLRSSRF